MIRTIKKTIMATLIACWMSNSVAMPLKLSSTLQSEKNVWVERVWIRWDATKEQQSLAEIIEELKSSGAHFVIVGTAQWWNQQSRESITVLHEKNWLGVIELSEEAWSSSDLSAIINPVIVHISKTAKKPNEIGAEQGQYVWINNQKKQKISHEKKVGSIWLLNIAQHSWMKTRDITATVKYWLTKDQKETYIQISTKAELEVLQNNLKQFAIASKKFQ